MPDPNANRQSGTSSFFDRFRSSFGFSEGREQSRTQDRDGKSFLVNAGALGTSVGLRGAAFALGNRTFSDKPVDTAPATGLSLDTNPSDRQPSPPPRKKSLTLKLWSGKYVQL
ncbi:hypothetical protein F4808DRAFT_461263 [Astrocystis sublimbata]|nr:hypothetical protein F4808DRAFT_461263 [Astrocystis sublimbata]